MIWLSLPLGLTAWVLPLLAKSRTVRKKSPFAVGSILACGLALLNVLYEILRRVQSGDLSALMDLTDALVTCGSLLVLGTVLVNAVLLLDRDDRLAYRLLRALPGAIRQGLPTFLIALLIQTGLFLPMSLYAMFFRDRHRITGDTLGMFWSWLALAAVVMLVIRYMNRVPTPKRSLAVPLAAAVFPAVEYMLILLPSYVNFKDVVPLYEWGHVWDKFRIFYAIPCLAVTICAIGGTRLVHWFRHRAGQNHEEDSGCGPTPETDS